MNKKEIKYEVRVAIAVQATKTLWKFALPESDEFTEEFSAAQWCPDGKTIYCFKIGTYYDKAQCREAQAKVQSLLHLASSGVRRSDADRIPACALFVPEHIRAGWLTKVSSPETVRLLHDLFSWPENPEMFDTYSVDIVQEFPVVGPNDCMMAYVHVVTAPVTEEDKLREQAKKLTKQVKQLEKFLNRKQEQLDDVLNKLNS